MPNVEKVDVFLKPQVCRVVRCVAMAVALLSTSRVTAQATRQTRENLNAWLTLNGEVALSRKWFADYDVSLRRSGPLDEWQQILPRVSARYQMLPNVRFNWGYNFAETFPFGKLPNAFRFPEHRMWEQVQLSQGVGRVSLTHRYRLEQRWLGRVASVNGEESVQNWVRTNRGRYRVQGTIPLQGPTTEDGEFYTHLGLEMFLNWGANVQFNVFDQNRLTWMVGRRFSKSLRVEAGYMEQLTEKASGRFLERNHTLLLTFFTSSSLVR